MKISVRWIFDDDGKWFVCRAHADDLDDVCVSQTAHYLHLLDEFQSVETRKYFLQNLLHIVAYISIAYPFKILSDNTQLWQAVQR